MLKKFFSKPTFIISNTILPIIITLFPSAVYAQTEKWSGVCVSSKDVATIQGLGCLIANAMSVVFSLLGVGGLIMLIVSGVRLMLSGGDAQNTRRAAGSIRNIIIGIVLALSSFLIVRLISTITGVDSILNLSLEAS